MSMMFITPEIVGNDMTQDQIDALVNEFVLSVDDFEIIACLDGSAHGVKSLCQSCGIEINPCVRKNLVSQLFQKNSLIIRDLGYYPNISYQSEEITLKSWMNGIIRVQLQYPGIEAVNLVNTATVELTSQPITYYFDATVVDDYIDVPMAQLHNPKNAIFRQANGTRVYTNDSKQPIRSGTNWRIYLDAMTPGDVITIYPCDIVFVDANTENSSQPVYPTSKQIIQQAKPAKIIDETTTRFYFRLPTLVDPIFVETGTDLSQANEYYKMLPDIDFIAFAEEEQPPILTYSECDCGSGKTSEENEDIIVEIVDAKRGIIELNLCNLTCKCNKLFKVKVFYKTNPILFCNQKYNVKEALAYIVAADLPMAACDCKIDKGFIKTAQTPYTEIIVNPITGNEVENFKHGNLYGQVEYSARLRKMEKFERAFRL